MSKGTQSKKAQEPEGKYAKRRPKPMSPRAGIKHGRKYAKGGCLK